MKRLIVFLLVLVMVICVLSLAPNRQVAGKTVDPRQQEVVNLCLVNAILADELNQRLDDEAGPADIVNTFFDKNSRPIEVVPTSNFFLQLKDLVEKGGKINYEEIKAELEKHKELLEEALINGNGQKFVAERIK